MLKTWIILVCLTFIWIADRSRKEIIWNDNAPLQEIQHVLAEPLHNHYLPYHLKKAGIGYDILKYNRVIEHNESILNYSRKQYVCETCHDNEEIGNSNLSDSEVQAKLEIVQSKYASSKESDPKKNLQP